MEKKGKTINGKRCVNQLGNRFQVDTNFLGIIKSSRNPNLLYRSHRLSFECSTLFVSSRSRRIFRLLYFSRMDLKRRSASVATYDHALRQIGKKMEIKSRNKCLTNTYAIIFSRTRGK